ncbi:MAG: hypothetical protein IKF68_06470 [Erysipelotrichaceae bacterium]|nr:hypothetical protein [Erysipelotrichaceae bacterium]
MRANVICGLCVCLGVTLLLVSGVVFIQDRRFFTTAPKDIQARLEDHRERFIGQHVLGYILAVIAIAVVIVSFACAVYDGIGKGYTFMDFFRRNMFILLFYKAYDIIFFDWLLLTRTHFFQHWYPETEGCAGYRNFGFNRKEQIKEILSFPLTAAIISLIAIMF